MVCCLFCVYGTDFVYTHTEEFEKNSYILIVSYRWVSIATPTPLDPQWADTPYQRYGHTAVALGDCAYIWGGRNDVDGACNVLFCMNTGECDAMRCEARRGEARRGEAM